MINWDYISYDISKAQKDFNQITVESTSIKPINPSEEFLKLREQLIEARDEVFEEYGFDTANKLDYKFDLTFGLKLYKYLNKHIGFTNRMASNDAIWRYLSLKVIPDIVHSRWQLNEDHFFKVSRRIWLKTIWWYIHLSWQGNEDATYETLKNNSTDTILQLVERPGIGYNVALYREVMKQYAKYEDKDRTLFRRVLVLNTARIVTISPELVEGGIQGYVEDLFKTVN